MAFVGPLIPKLCMFTIFDLLTKSFFKLKAKFLLKTPKKLICWPESILFYFIFTFKVKFEFLFFKILIFP